MQEKPLKITIIQIKGFLLLNILEFRNHTQVHDQIISSPAIFEILLKKSCFDRVLTCNLECDVSPNKMIMYMQCYFQSVNLIRNALNFTNVSIFSFFFNVDFCCC